MKRVKIIILMATMGIIASCHHGETKSINDINPDIKHLDDFNNKKKIDSLSEALESGDVAAYQQLKKIYMYSGHKRDFLRHSLVMCKEFNYPPAYLDTYFILKTDVINKQNENINIMANYFLLKAYENKVRYAENSVSERFGDVSKIPNSTAYSKSKGICGY